MRREGQLSLQEEKQWPPVQERQILALNFHQENLVEDSVRQGGDIIEQSRQSIVHGDGGQVLVQLVQDLGQGEQEAQIQVQEEHSQDVQVEASIQKTLKQRQDKIPVKVQNLLQEGQHLYQKVQTPAQDANEEDALRQIGQSGKEVCNLIQKEFISQLSTVQEIIEPGCSSNNQATISNSSFKQQDCTERINHNDKDLNPSETDDTNKQNDNIPDVTLAKSTRKQYACTFCNKMFNSVDNVDYHKAFQHPIVVTNSNNEKKTFSCRLCLERFDVKKR